MKLFFGLTLFAALCSSCIYVPGRHGFRRGVVRSAVRADCPPAHHWDGNACRHNGNGNGNGNGRGNGK